MLPPTSFNVDMKMLQTDCDFRGRPLPHRLLALSQTAAFLHIQHYPPLVDQKLKAQGVIWMITGFSLTMDVITPAVGDTISCTTWSPGLKGIRFLRNYRFTRGDRSFAEACNQWILVDQASRRPLRPKEVLPPQDEARYFPAMLEKQFSIPKIPDLFTPEDRARGTVEFFERRFRASYSELDGNHHLNNIYYTSWALDTVADFLLQNNPEAGIAALAPYNLKQIDCNYVAEVLPGDQVAVFLRALPAEAGQAVTTFVLQGWNVTREECAFRASLRVE